MVPTLFSAFKLPDLRNRVLFIFFGFAIFIFGLHVSIPGIDKAALESLFGGGGLLGLLDVFTGGALKKFSIFAMGITPYINASIMMQLLTMIFPQIKEIQQEEGEFGRRKISQYTRYLTIALAAVQATGLTMWLRSSNVLEDLSVIHYVRVILTLVGGTAFLMWLGEQISDKGIGNGVSLIIFCGIIARMPSDVARTAEIYKTGGIGILNILGLIAIGIVIIAGIIFIEMAERRIAVQYAKQMRGRKMYGGGSTFLPVKVNSAGVIPIIFAVSVLLFPATIAQMIPSLKAFSSTFTSSWYYHATYYILVVGFTYFYTAIVFDPNEVAENIKKYGGFIPGIRPGKPTAEYLDKVASRLTFIGANFLAIIAVIPTIVIGITRVPTFYLGGTSLLIVVGVALETVKQLESQMVMRNYEGFIK